VYQTIVPPLLQEYFNYGTVENSYFFMGVGVEFVLVYVVLLVVLGKKEERWWSVSERSALLFSAACLVISLVAFVVLGQFMAPGEFISFDHQQSFIISLVFFRTQ
jgi:phosphatidylserine synthase